MDDTMGRDVIELMEKLDMKDITTQMVLQCAPLFTGLKVSNLLIIPAGNGNLVRTALEGTDISFRKLSEFKNKATYILFRRDLLTEWILEEDNRQFLADWGYEGCSLDSILNAIENQYCSYVRENTAFPHEIGILLGYPAEDVQGFVNNEGKNYLCSGYWKVYGHPSEKKRLFQRFDQAKKTLLRVIAMGVEIQSVIVNSVECPRGSAA